MSLAEKQDTTDPDHRRAGERSPLLDPSWHYIPRPTLDDFTVEDWALMDRQRAVYNREEPGRQALEMLEAQRHAPSFGYEINNFEHCLQTATLAMQAGEDEETIVVSLFHDLGFVTNNDTHGEFAAQLLRPYVSNRNIWMLERHMYFQAVHCDTHPAIDLTVRDRWQGHPWFEYTANWVARYDQTSIIARFESAPISVFEPMVHRIFSRPRRPMAVPM